MYVVGCYSLAVLIAMVSLDSERGHHHKVGDDGWSSD
jgi:hypothetical protein